MSSRQRQPCDITNSIFAVPPASVLPISCIIPMSPSAAPAAPPLFFHTFFRQSSPFPSQFFYTFTTTSLSRQIDIKISITEHYVELYTFSTGFSTTANPFCSNGFSCLWEKLSIFPALVLMRLIFSNSVYITTLFAYMHHCSAFPNTLPDLPAVFTSFSIRHIGRQEKKASGFP